MTLLFGRIECQLQTENQYRFGNYGFAAHGKLKGKKIRPLPIPTESAEAKMKEFRTQLKGIIPNNYLARMDDNYRGRAFIIELGDVQDYLKILSQISEGDPDEKFLRNYANRLRVLSHTFDKGSRSFGFTRQDIEEYITSDYFMEFLNMANEFNKDNWTSNQRDFSKPEGCGRKPEIDEGR